MRTVLAGLAVAVTAAVASPASAAGPTIEQARKAVAQACADSLSALAEGGAVSGPAQVTLEPGRFRVSLPGAERMVVESSGTFGPLSETVLTSKERKAARAYAGITGATKHWLYARHFAAQDSWGATFDESMADATGLADCTRGLTTGPVSRDGGTWTFEAHDAVFRIGDDGRLLSARRDGVSSDFSYTPAAVDVPATTVGYRTWRKASEAASLNSTMRTMCRAVAAEVNDGVPELDAISDSMLAHLPVDRVVPLKLRALRRGTLVHARNPYAKTYHAWRVYLKGGRVLAKKVAPLT